jgi:hypothetical protein
MAESLDFSMIFRMEGSERAVFNNSSLVRILVRVNGPSLVFRKSAAYISGCGVGVGVGVGLLLFPVKLQSLHANSSTAIRARLERGFTFVC